jgi:hypothetical protein
MAARVRLWRAGAEDHTIKVVLRGDDADAVHAHLVAQAIAQLGDADAEPDSVSFFDKDGDRVTVVNMLDGDVLRSCASSLALRRRRSDSDQLHRRRRHRRALQQTNHIWVIDYLKCST